MPDYVWDYYETSSPMSSYLVAFLVAEFEAVPAPTGLNRVPFRIWTRPDFVYKTGFDLFSYFSVKLLLPPLCFVT